jgi:HAMP domain-containing protein
MESQTQQPEDNTPKSLEAATALNTVPQSQLSPTAQSIQKGQWIFTQILSFVVQSFNYLGSFFNTYKQLVIVVVLFLAAFVTLRIVLAAMDALNDIPLLAPTFKLVGIGYSVWFVNRYLLKTSTRQELIQRLQSFLGAQVSMEDESPKST